jgi:hypothetical protein
MKPTDKPTQAASTGQLKTRIQCFACDKDLPAKYYEADTRDDQTVFVGPDCFARIKKAGDAGYL